MITDSGMEAEDRQKVTMLRVATKFYVPPFICGSGKNAMQLYHLLVKAEQEAREVTGIEMFMAGRCSDTMWRKR